jgi:ribosomal protein S13
MVEIEIGVLNRQCLDRRISNKATLKREVARWERMRNKERARVRWRFTVENARTRLGRTYPQAPAAPAAA